MVMQYRPIWSTASGGTGYSVLNFDDQPGAAQPIANAVRALFAALAANMPSDVTISFPDEMTVHNVSTGDLTSTVPVTPPANVVGGSSSAYPAPSGFHIQWATGEIVNGRRLQGKTFIVPAAGSAYDLDGTISATVITSSATAINTYLTAIANAGADMVVWSRTAGVARAVLSGSVRDQAAVLRTRRD